MDNRDITKITVMYTNYQGNLLSDEQTDMTAYPILVGFDKDRRVVVIPVNPERLQDIERNEEEEE